MIINRISDVTESSFFLLGIYCQSSYSKQYALVLLIYIPKKTWTVSQVFVPNTSSLYIVIRP